MTATLSDPRIGALVLGVACFGLGLLAGVNLRRTPAAPLVVVPAADPDPSYEQARATGHPSTWDPDDVDTDERPALHLVWPPA